jgi:glycosyltransferase involved in cell wall biosynthesis
METHMSDLAKALRRVGIDVSVFCLRVPTTLAASEVIDGVPVHRVRPWLIRQTPVWCGPLLSDMPHDILHFHGFSRPLFLRAVLDRRGTPLVVTLHGGLIGAASDEVNWRRAAKRVFDRTAGRWLLSRATGVIALSQQEASDLQARDVDPRRIFVLPNAVSLPVTQPAAQRHNARLLILARQAKRKRITDLLITIANNPELPGCDIAGPEGDGSSEIRRVASSLPSGKVRFFGPVQGREKDELLRSALALVLCSAWEGHSIAALEAIAAGTPVIAADTAAVGLPDDGVLTYPCGDLAALAAAISAVHNPASREAIVRSLEAVKLRMMTFEEYVRKIVSIYETACTRR